MGPVRQLVASGATPVQAADAIQHADQLSWDVFVAIVQSGELRTADPGDEAPARVCLSECTLPGLLGLAERYGRFGFVFGKDAAFAAGARPCLYMDIEHRRWLIDAAKDGGDSSTAWQLAALSNIYRPVVAGGRIQDFTHEREWRAFEPLSLSDVSPLAVVVPTAFVGEAVDLLSGYSLPSPVLPIEMLFEWGV